uniref:Transcription factor LIM n=1 Tax=Solanum tuberosum TaxID=4113 RepID=M1APS3_SOLTU
MAFAGTTQKCMACDKTVYLVDKLTADNRIYHKACFRCHHCKGTLKVSSYDSLLYFVDNCGVRMSFCTARLIPHDTC